MIGTALDLVVSYDSANNNYRVVDKNSGYIYYRTFAQPIYAREMIADLTATEKLWQKRT